MLLHVDEVTNYYNQRGADVFVVFFDASKAFDRVNLIISIYLMS